MKVIGLVGGIAAGKSLVANRLQELGASVLDADRFGHEVLREEEVAALLIARWGKGILTPEGEISRPAVARIVFAPAPSGPEELRFLESVSHPAIRRKIREQLDLLASHESAEQKSGVAHQRIVVLDAPLLLEGGWDSFCDEIVFVDAPAELRAARGQSRGWTAAEFASREARQLPLEEKRRRATKTIDNSGPAEATLQQVDLLWQKIL